MSYWNIQFKLLIEHFSFVKFGDLFEILFKKYFKQLRPIFTSHERQYKPSVKNKDTIIVRVCHYIDYNSGNYLHFKSTLTWKLIFFDLLHCDKQQIPCVNCTWFDFWETLYRKHSVIKVIFTLIFLIIIMITTAIINYNKM